MISPLPKNKKLKKFFKRKNKPFNFIRETLY